MKDFLCDETDLADIPLTPCSIAERIGQMEKLIFQKKQATTTFADLATLQAQATWTALQGAIDATKIHVSPFTADAVIPMSEEIKEGGNDNSNRLGLPTLFGEGFVTVTGMLKDISPEVANVLRSYSKFSLPERAQGSELTVYIASEGKGCTCEKNTAGEYFGIPIYNWRVSSLGNEGKNAQKTYAFSFDLPECWDENVVTERLDFDLTSLF